MSITTRKFATNLQAIRLGAAYLVLIRHSFILFGSQSPLAGIHLPPVGIWIFFAISGYLLPGSWVRNPRIRPYAAARFRRLIPQLAVVVLLSAFMLGPLLTTLSFSEYLSHPQTWNYLLNLVFHPEYSLPGVFAENYYPHAVNGSLWSLPPQLLAYLLVPTVFLLRFRAARIAVWVIILMLAFWGYYDSNFAEVIVWGNDISQALGPLALFAVGALLRESRATLNLGIAGFLLLILTLGSWLLPDAQFLLLAVTIPYVVMTVALRSWPILRTANQLPDISYGIFLVGFPVQQAMIAVVPALHPLPSMVITLIASTLIALALERYIERPILERAERKRTRVAALTQP